MLVLGLVKSRELELNLRAGVVVQLPVLCALWCHKYFLSLTKKYTRNNLVLNFFTK
jgi:uncharacterized membrane protein